MNRLHPVSKQEDIFSQYRGAPIGLLLEYHNLNRNLDAHTQAQLLIGMCMDNRKQIRTPDNFAYIIRAGGVNLRNSEFKASYAIAVGGVKSIALIGHTQCGMVNLASKKTAFIKGLVDHAGWERESAEDHFNYHAPMFEIGNEVDFVLSEAKRLRSAHPSPTGRRGLVVARWWINSPAGHAWIRRISLALKTSSIAGAQVWCWSGESCPVSARSSASRPGWRACPSSPFLPPPLLAHTSGAPC